LSFGSTNAKLYVGSFKYYFAARFSNIHDLSTVINDFNHWYISICSFNKIHSNGTYLILLHLVRFDFSGRNSKYTLC
jgi:hypothetical protein